MKTAVLRFASVLALALTFLTAFPVYGQAQPCPNPLPPFTPQSGGWALVLLPTPATADDEQYYWVIAEQIQLESHTVVRTGNTITVTTYLHDFGDDTMRPPTCFRISVGKLAPGRYTLRGIRYSRFGTDNTYLTTPTFDISRTFEVLAGAPTAIPMLGMWSAALFAALCSLALLFSKHVPPNNSTKL